MLLLVMAGNVVVYLGHEAGWCVSVLPIGCHQRGVMPIRVLGFRVVTAVMCRTVVLCWGLLVYYEG